MSDCFDGAYVFASSAEYYAVVWILYDSSLFSVFFFKFEYAVVAVVYAFSARNTFLIVYYWVPRDFVSRDSLMFLQSFLLSPCLKGS